MSVHEALVVPISLIKHPNADALSTCKIGDYTVVCRTEDWVGKTKACYLEPDTLCDVTLPQFSFLAQDAKYNPDSTIGGSFARIKAKKLRGIQSYGVLIPVDENMEIGQNLYEAWNLHRYEPQLQSPNSKWGFMTSGEVASAPKIGASLPKYDVESFMKYGRKIFVEGEPVIGTLKYHGCNGRYIYTDGNFHCSSRTEFKKQFASPPTANKDTLIAKLGEEKGIEVFNKITEKQQNWQPTVNLWWRVLNENEWLQKFCRDNPDVAVYGEVIGVQGIKFLYGLNPGQVGFKVFDLMKDGQWMNHYEAREFGKDLQWVKTLHEILYDTEKVIELVEQMGVHENVGGYEEGIVWKTPIERFNDYIGRTQVKLINPKYLEKS